MEFHEKLQMLRKSRGITQEELAKDLYVSRTAVSKWESGRGYPSIDSLKEIAGYFSVTVDELLSGEKILSIAQNENRSNIRTIFDYLLSLADICYLMLVLLPLYPNEVGDYVYSVNLFLYDQVTKLSGTLHWCLFASVVAVGAVKFLLTKLRVKKGDKLLTVLSVVLGVASALFLCMARESYATALAVLLICAKGVFLIKRTKAGG